MSTIYRKPDQIIQPWQFGHGETKATCLWLKGFPKLIPTNIVSGREHRIHRMPPSPDRGKLRSKTFPEELVETPILAGCPEGGVVLDPFMGSGTVAKVALRANRQFIGLEANQEYIDMANKRIEFERKQLSLF